MPRKVDRVVGRSRGVSSRGAFADVLDTSGGGRRRAVDVTTESYQVARAYMVRLGARDFTDPAWVAALAKAGGLGEDAFRDRFGRFASLQN